ncbi:hypothetical protein [Nostoc sp. LPT]|uniref:hypothetical protein n=1 Tax=Nostoc sp. LPT TaxID=2815387 RepID=UPI001DE48CC6|nr:hypothetical protein [Nostoc sp. LPT]MBN4006333.1 hypothetical protein [Nostoc sp. LPT]
MPGITTWTIHIQVPTNSYSIMQRRIYIKKWQGAFVEANASVQCVSLKKRLLLDIVDAGSLSNVPGSCVFAIAIMNVFCHNWNQVDKICVTAIFR